MTYQLLVNHAKVINNYQFNTRTYDKRDDLAFPIANFPFLDGECSFSPILISNLYQCLKLH